MAFEKDNLENRLHKGGIKRKHHSKVPSSHSHPLRSPHSNKKSDTHNPTPRSQSKKIDRSPLN